MKKVSAGVVVVFFLAGCDASPPVDTSPVYCQFDANGHRVDELVFDFEEMRVDGGDVIYPIQRIQNEDFLGYISPYQILIPSPERLRESSSTSWTYDGYSYRAMSYLDMDSTLVAVYSKRATVGTGLSARYRSSTFVLYSIDDGLRLLRSTTHDGNSAISAEYIHCGGTALYVSGDIDDD